MIFPTLWYVRQTKPQISLRIHAVWSEPLLVACIFYECSVTNWTSSGISKLVWVYTCQNTTLLEITCRGALAIKRTCFEIHSPVPSRKWNVSISEMEIISFIINFICNYAICYGHAQIPKVRFSIKALFNRISTGYIYIYLTIFKIRVVDFKLPIDPYPHP